MRNLFPFYFLLLCFFFVLHGVNENFRHVPYSVAGVILGTFLIAGILLFFLSLLLLRSREKAALFTFILLSINFFFGSFQDTVRSSHLLRSFSHYKVILPLIAVLILSALLLMRRSRRSFKRLTHYLNLLLTLLVATELLVLAWNALTVQSRSATAPIVSRESSESPDIYFLVLDAYAGHESLQSYFQYDNSPMEDQLRNKGFFVSRRSHSNYNFTPFSMASMLNMQFIENLEDTANCHAEDYLKRAEEIKQNAVCRYLEAKGYKILNYSVFDLEGQPTPVSETFLPFKGRLLTDQTLLNRMKKDLGHLLKVGKYAISLFRIDPYTTYHNNETLIRLTEESLSRSSEQPQFVYTHLYMPHPPYYYDDNQQLRPDIELEEKLTETEERRLYFNNLVATNKKVGNLIDSILGQTGRRAVIIVSGDHGYRPQGTSYDPRVFNTLNAVFLPSNNYLHYYDSISNINQFPVLFNTLFADSLALKKDSSIFLLDAH